MIKPKMVKILISRVAGPETKKNYKRVDTRGTSGGLVVRQ